MAAREHLTIPGEQKLAGRIREAAGRGALGHAAILSGSGGLAEAARFMAAAFQCRGEDKPCGICPDCRKVLKGVHPDVAVVEDPDHKNVAVDVLRGVVSDASVLPNEGGRKVYIFPDCSLLDGKAQNVLLKVIEDGPSHAAFIFCAENSAVLLPTIRSRTTEWKLSPPPDAAEGDGQAVRFCEILCGGKAAELAAFCAELENSKISREELRGLLSDARDLLASGLAVCCGVERGPLAVRLSEGMGKYRLSEAAEILGRYIRECGYNVGVGHLTGALAVELSGQSVCRSVAN